MARIVQFQVFSWQDVDRSSDLDRFRLVLEALPDEDLVAALEQKRGKRGRNTFPVRACFNAVLAGIVFQHPSVESLLRELCRNGELREACGFEVLGGAQAVPSSFAMSRFLSSLIQKRDRIDAMFHELVDRVAVCLPDFGEHLAFDGKAVPSFSTGRADRQTGETSDPDAAWGTKTYRGTNSQGTSWKKVTHWFGYQLHLIVDSRQLWKDEKQEQDYDPALEITRALNPDGLDNIVYTERGGVRCVDPVTGEERAMAFRGFEADREAVGYRCPSAAYGCTCPGRSQCELAALGRATDFGRMVRVPLSKDRRIFTPIPRDSPSWKRLYAERSSVERVNARIDQSFGFERHTIRGLEKMRARMGLALAVMLALAIGHLERGQPEMIRSLVGNPRKRRAA